MTEKTSRGAAATSCSAEDLRARTSGSAGARRRLAGAFYSYKGERIAQGRDKAAAFMNENPKIAAEIRVRLVEIRRVELAGTPVMVAAPGEAAAA